ncbi:MAG: PKD domain-containing protein [Saprospiraceae bacterium]
MQKNLLFLLCLIPTFLFSQNTYDTPFEGVLDISDCDGILYDMGGQNGGYDVNSNSIVHLEGTSGDYLELTFTEFDVENSFDNLFIIEGDSITGNIIGFYSGNTLPNNGEPILVNGLEVTIFFQSDFTINGDGYAMEFACKSLTSPPTADISFPSFTCGGSVNFSDQSTGFPSSWAWDFGDGNTSTEQNPAHNYSVEGTYTVSMITCNTNGCDTVVVPDAITYDASNFICNNGFTMPAYGSDTAQTCSGVLYDSGGSTGDYTSGNYGQFLIAPPGGNSISVTFTEFDLGNFGEHTDVLYFYDGATFNYLGGYFGQDLPNNGQTITFNVSSLLVGFSSDHENNFSGFSMLWEVNGSAVAPVSSFSADTNTIPFGGSVSFTDQSLNNPGIWEWDFGDGQTSNEQNPTHTYNSAGTFEVNMIATNCTGSDTMKNVFITVQEPPAITINPDSINVTMNAGTMGTQTVTICNNGSGDLVLDINSLGQGGSGYLFGFQTNENGADFSWALLDPDFNVLQESQQTYGANQLYQENIFIPDPSLEYYLALYSLEGIPALEQVIWYDPFTGDIAWQGFLETGPNSIYILPAFSFPIDPNMGSQLDWLDIDNTPTVIAPSTCQDYEVTLDAIDLNGGIYTGEIIINSNDPNQATSIIPVTLTVVGTPEIAVTPTTLDYGDTQVGASSTLSFTIENMGSDDLNVSGLVSNDPAFVINSMSDLILLPNTSQTIEVTFTPTEMISYASSISIVNNVGDDITVDFLGNGVPSPTLTIDPTEFTLELIQGEDSTLVVNLGNVGAADLNYTATSSTDDTGFDFTFTTDNWGGEFFWELVDGQGNTVISWSGEFYEAFTTYTESFTGLSASESYTLRMFDSFGDGALSNYTVNDRSTGQMITQGSFPNGAELFVDLGSPIEGSSIITPNQGILSIGGTQALDIFISSVGLATGTYNIVVTVATNDPTQPFVDVNITLYVIAPVTTDFVAQTFICGNLPVQFNDLTINVPTSWAWDFGDGTTSSLQSPIHTYAGSGTYSVSLVACNSLGCDTINKTDYITVETDCYAQNIPTNHGIETITVCEGSVYDSGGANGDYIEGNASQLVIAPFGAESVTITFSEFNYEEHGDYLYVYDGDAFTGTLIGSYTGTELSGQTLLATSGKMTLYEYTNHFINLSGFAATFTCSTDPIAPVANFNFFADSVLCANQPVIFNDASQGNVTQWFWDFGDGGISNQQNTFHQYTASGTYNVSLTACNDAGCDTYIETISIEVDNGCIVDEVPTNNYLYGPVVISSCFGTLYDSGGSDENYVDNNFGVITIYQPGIGITFSAFDYDENDFVAIYDGLDVNAPLIGYYTGDELPENGTTIFASGEGLTIAEFTDFGSNASGFELTYACPNIGLVSGGTSIIVMNDDICDGVRQFMTPDTMLVDTWNWNFGDNTTSSEAAPMHEFPHNGIFEVSLEACYQGDCETYLINIHSNKLTPEIIAPGEVIVGEDVQFEGMTMEATHWNWDFGNGEFSDHNTPTTVYGDTGYHDVHIHLINMNVHETCDASHTHTILVKPENSTSTQDLDKKEIRVYPNPANEFIQIDFENSMVADFEVQLFTINGQLVRSIQNAIQVNTADLVNGTYVLKVIQEDIAPQQFKIMVQHN